MKRIAIAAALMMLVSVTLLKAQNNSETIIGKWESESKDTKIEIYKSGTTYCGKIIWTKNGFEADGKTSKKDVKNPEPSLRSRNIIGMVFITGLVVEDDEFINGKVYDATSGKTYNCKVTISDGQLELRGYIGSPLLGGTVTWNRIK